MAAGQIKVVSWNINGLRSVARSGALADMVADVRPDVLCLQETRCDERTAIDMLTDMFPQWHVRCSAASKKGYAGVAILSSPRLPLSDVRTLFPGRALSARVGPFTVVSVYALNAGAGLKNLDERVGIWDPFFRDTVCDAAGAGLVVAGDLNVARDDIDVFDPDALRRTAGFTQEERREFERTMRARRLIDTFRSQHPGVRRYSFWSTRSRRARLLRRGWRIDYVLVSRDVQHREADVLEHVEGSDHAPVVCTCCCGCTAVKYATSPPPARSVESSSDAVAVTDASSSTDGTAFLESAAVLYLTAVLLRRLREGTDGALRNAEFHVLAYDRVIASIRDGSIDVFAADLTSQPGVGQKIAAKIDEVRRTGRIAEVTEADRRLADLVLRVTSMYGFGYVTAVRLVHRHGIESVRDLDRVPLTRAQRQGLLHAEDLRTRIPRSEMDEHRRIVLDVANEVNRAGGRIQQCDLVGSYARGRPDSGDVDVLIVTPLPGRDGPEFLRLLHRREYLVSPPPAGPSFKMYLGLCRIVDGATVRRIDVMVTEPKHAVFARLYFMGPARFTVAMRRRAKAMGLTLNERGLFAKAEGRKRSDGSDEEDKEGGEHEISRRWALRDEADVFRRLGLPYVVPSARDDLPPSYFQAKKS